jgi:predicted NAD/FAD-binding protein
VRSVERGKPNGVVVTDANGDADIYDHVVLATNADQALGLLSDPTAAERDLLGAFRYSRNSAVLHSDESLMPRRRAAWASWNHIGRRGAAADGAGVTYWMNRLQGIGNDTPLFVTLNPPQAPRAGSILHSEWYEHPIFDAKAIAAQRRLWSLQGKRNIWFCGSYFGAGFHEDGLQAGLAVAEQLGGARRPWRVAEESGRIALGSRGDTALAAEAA